MSLVLSSDAKPRLKWTPELRQRFIDAVNELGGAEKATPKALMRVMGIHGLTLYHLKSHLQKYRLGRSQQSQTQTCQHNKQEDSGENQRNQAINEACHETNNHINESLQVTHALQMQMEVQRKLHEQIEVQRHLQLRIEAQGKYLQSVLKKAQETLSGYSACSIEVEQAKAQLSQLASMVDSGCTNSSLTECDDLMLSERTKTLTGHNRYSLESSQTSSESSGRKEETQQKHAQVDKRKRDYVALSFMETNPSTSDEPENAARDGKRSRSAIHSDEMQKLRVSEDIDLNCSSLNEIDSGPKLIDLNSSVKLFGSTFSV